MTPLGVAQRGDIFNSDIPVLSLDHLFFAANINRLLVRSALQSVLDLDVGAISTVSNRHTLGLPGYLKSRLNSSLER